MFHQDMAEHMRKIIDEELIAMLKNASYDQESLLMVCHNCDKEGWVNVILFQLLIPEQANKDWSVSTTKDWWCSGFIIWREVLLNSRFDQWSIGCNMWPKRTLRRLHSPATGAYLNSWGCHLNCVMHNQWCKQTSTFFYCSSSGKPV